MPYTIYYYLYIIQPPGGRPIHSDSGFALSRGKDWSPFLDPGGGGGGLVSMSGLWLAGLNVWIRPVVSDAWFGWNPASLI